MKILNKILGTVALLLVAAMPVASADVVYQFTNPAFSGDDLSLDSSTVFATATFKQNGEGLQLWLEVSDSMPDSSNASAWYFNINATPLSGLSFSNAGVQDAILADSWLIRSQNTCCTADGSGEYDFAIFFDPNTGQLKAGTFAVIDISFTSTLSLDMFDGALSDKQGTNDGFGAAIHVQRIEGGQEGSGWFVSNCVTNPQTGLCGDDGGGGGEQEIPEPGTLAILGAGLLSLAYIRRRCTH